MSRTAVAGACAWAVVFGAGFVLGVARQTLVAPFLGDLVAVVAELPIMLALSWWACDWAIRRFGVPPTFRHRALMGAVAFALLMASELTVSLWGFGRGVGEHLATYLSPPAALGLGAQLCFAAFPLARLAFEPDRAVGGPAASRGLRKLDAGRVRWPQL